MTNTERVGLLRDGLGTCQVALNRLTQHLDLLGDRKAMHLAGQVQDALLILEAAAGAVETPAALFE